MDKVGDLVNEELFDHLSRNGQGSRLISSRETMMIQKIDSQEDPDKKASKFIRRIVTDNIKEVYDFREKIGTGSFGTVRLASLKSNGGKTFAIKSIKREKIEFRKPEYISPTLLAFFKKKKIRKLSKNDLFK